MTQYEDRVERQRIKLEAEEWAKGFKSLHNHSLSSMWYDNRPQDTEDGKRVTDIQYNSGLVKRIIHSDGDMVVYFSKEELKGTDLLDAYVKNTQ